MEVASIVASLVSLILAIIAIWQAIHFYTQGKNTESRVEIALASIKGQVETLKSINSRTLDRLTKYVTSPREDPAFKTIEALSETFRDIPAIISGLKNPSDTTTEDSMREELFVSYICIWYYSAHTNVLTSFSLPSVNEFDEKEPYHAYLKSLIDRSAADFDHMSDIINQLDEDEITASEYGHLYDEVQQHLLPLVGDTAHHFTQDLKSLND